MSRICRDEQHLLISVNVESHLPRHAYGASLELSDISIENHENPEDTRYCAGKTGRVQLIQGDPAQERQFFDCFATAYDAVCDQNDCRGREDCFAAVRKPPAVAKYEGGAMFLRHVSSGDIVEVMDVEALFDPFRNEVKGRFHAGEEMPDPSGFRKSEMVFLSGERLPRCWVDPHYKERKI